MLFATFVISLFVAVPKDTQVLCARPTCVRTTNVQCPMSVLLTTISPLPVGKTSGLIYPLTFPLSTSSHLPLTSMSSTTSYTHYPIPMHGSRNFFILSSSEIYGRLCAVPFPVMGFQRYHYIFLCLSIIHFIFHIFHSLSYHPVCLLTVESYELDYQLVVIHVSLII